MKQDVVTAVRFAISEHQFVEVPTPGLDLLDVVLGEPLHGCSCGKWLVAEDTVGIEEFLDHQAEEVALAASRAMER